MNDAQVIKKFASDVIEMANHACALADAAINVKKMQKEASAKAVSQELNATKLAKAASAVAQLYGDRAAVNADSLQRIWAGNHNALVDSLVKVASDAVSSKVREPQMVVVKKQATAAPSKPKYSHADDFDRAFGLK